MYRRTGILNPGICILVRHTTSVSVGHDASTVQPKMCHLGTMAVCTLRSCGFTRDVVPSSSTRPSKTFTYSRGSCQDVECRVRRRCSQDWGRPLHPSINRMRPDWPVCILGRTFSDMVAMNARYYVRVVIEHATKPIYTPHPVPRCGVLRNYILAGI